jgi:hypothetical protein
MSRDDSSIWRARAEEMRRLVDKAEGRISKELLLRIAEDYELFAQSIEQRPDRFLPPEEAVPAEVRRFGQRKASVGAPPLIPDAVPEFLRRARSTAQEPSDDQDS